MSRFTILGAGGFIGAAIGDFLRRIGHEVHPIHRDGVAPLLDGGRPAGHVIYCIGLTGDFRTRPLDTADAHVGLVGRILARVPLDSFLYLSSTRIYARAEVAREEVPIAVLPGMPSDLYNVTKLAGEALCLSDPRPTIRAARLSNVYGAAMGTDSFLGQVLAEGRATGQVTLRQSLLSAKDYVALDDVVRILVAIAERGAARLYNVASGVNITHDALAVALTRRLGWRIAAADGVTAVRFPRIDIQRATIEFGAPRHHILEDLPSLGSLQRQEVAC